MARWARKRATRWPPSSRSRPPRTPSNCCSRGGHLWNAGILLVQAKVLIAALEQHAPDILEAAGRPRRPSKTDGDFLRMDAHAFEPLPQPEHRLRGARKMRAGRSASPSRGAGAMSAAGMRSPTCTRRTSTATGSAARASPWAPRNTFIYAPNRPVVALGTKDLLVVDTPDALLVAHSGLRRTGQGRGRTADDARPQPGHDAIAASRVPGAPTTASTMAIVSPSSA